MLELPQPGPARHQQGQLGFGAIARTVIDVNDLEARTLVEAGSDLGDQRSNVPGLVAHWDHNGNRGRHPAGRRVAHSSPLPSEARRAELYGAISWRATLLMRAKEGPGSGPMRP